MSGRYKINPIYHGDPDGTVEERQSLNTIKFVPQVSQVYKMLVIANVVVRATDVLLPGWLCWSLSSRVFGIVHYVCEPNFTIPIVIPILGIENIEYHHILVNRFVYIALPRLNPMYKIRQCATRLNIEASNTAEIVCTGRSGVFLFS